MLCLNPAHRYSEDIDLVQIKKGPIKPIMQDSKRPPNNIFIAIILFEKIK